MGEIAMKKLTVVCFFCLLSFLIISCDKFNSEMSLVKKGVLEFDKSLTVGQAFDNYKYFKETKWEVITTENGKKIVQVTGDFDVSKFSEPYKSNVKNMYAKFQFQINQDKTFDLGWCGVGGERNDGSKLEPETNANTLECISSMKEIYDNKCPFKE